MDSEFSRAIAVVSLDGEGERFDIEADARERAAVAARLGVLAVDRLEASVVLVPVVAGRIVRLEGTVRARVVQRCVVSLLPVDAVIEEAFSVVYSRDVVDEPETAVCIDLDEAASPEPLPGDRIDVGEAVTQQLALALDSYPRRPDAVPPAVPGAEALTDVDDGSGGFAALGALKTSK